MAPRSGAPMERTGKRRPKSGWVGSVTSISVTFSAGFLKGVSSWGFVALRDIPFNKPGCAYPGLVNRVERGVAASSRSKAVRMVAELRFVISFQDGANHFLHQLVRPGR